LVSAAVDQSASHGVETLEALCASQPVVYLVHHVVGTCPVSKTASHASTSRPLKTLASRFILLALSPLQSSFAFPPARHLSTLRRYLLWVSSLFTTSPNGVPLCERVPSLTAPPSGFLSLATVFSAIQLAGLFHPTAMYRVHPVQGLLPSCSSSSSSKERLPPCRFTNNRSPTEVGCHSCSPRLRGFAPHEEALL